MLLRRLVEVSVSWHYTEYIHRERPYLTGSILSRYTASSPSTMTRICAPSVP